MRARRRAGREDGDAVDGGEADSRCPIGETLADVQMYGALKLAGCEAGLLRSPLIAAEVAAIIGGSTGFGPERLRQDP